MWTSNLWTQGWSQKIRSRGFYLLYFHSVQARLNLSLIELSTLILQAHLKNPSTPLPSKTQTSLFVRRCSCLPLPHLSLALLSLSPSLPPSLPVLLSMNMLLLTLKTSHQMGLGIHSAPQLPICFQSRGREIHRHKGAFVLLPSGLRCSCGRGTTGRSPDQNVPPKKRHYLAPNDTPWHSQLNQPAGKFPHNVNQNYFLWHGRFLKSAPLVV